VAGFQAKEISFFERFGFSSFGSGRESKAFSSSRAASSRSNSSSQAKLLSSLIAGIFSPEPIEFISGGEVLSGPIPLEAGRSFSAEGEFFSLFEGRQFIFL